MVDTHTHIYTYTYAVVEWIPAAMWIQFAHWINFTCLCAFFVSGVFRAGKRSISRTNFGFIFVFSDLLRAPAPLCDHGL